MLRRASALIVLAAGVLPACGGGSSGGGAAAPSNGTGAGGLGPPFGGGVVPAVAFLADKNVDGVPELFVADGAGVTLRNLSGPLPDAGRVAWLTWSPDRSRIAFEAEKDANLVLQLWSVPATGGTPVRLSSASGAFLGYAAAWSPDSTRVAYLSNQADGDRSDLFVSPATGPAGTVKVSSGIAAGGTARVHSWNAAGTFLAYRRAPAGAGMDVCVAAADGSSHVVVSAPGVLYPTVSLVLWSPAGDRLAYVVLEPSTNRDELWIATADGASRVRVSDAPGLLAGETAWRPDGSRLAWLADSRAWTCLADGTGMVDVSGAPAAGSVLFLQWAPDGSRLAYMGGGASPLFTVLPDGTGRVQVSDTLNPNFRMAWAPDSGRLAYRAQSGSFTQLFTSFPAAVGFTQLSAGSVTGSEWAPDSSALAYRAVESPSTSTELYAVLPDGTGRQKISGPLVAGGAVGNLAWSPDGARVIYAADQDVDGQTELYASLPGGGGNVKLCGPMTSGGDVTMVRVR